MQNKPNLVRRRRVANSVYTMDYENKWPWRVRKNKPNSKPIKPNFKRAKMNINSLITKDYRKKDDFAVRKNKPNSNPISETPKMSANLYFIEDYDNETAFRPKKTNPISVKKCRKYPALIVLYTSNTPPLPQGLNSLQWWALSIIVLKK